MSATGSPDLRPATSSSTGNTMSPVVTRSNFNSKDFLTGRIPSPMSTYVANTTAQVTLVIMKTGIRLFFARRPIVCIPLHLRLPMFSVTTISVCFTRHLCYTVTIWFTKVLCPVTPSTDGFPVTNRWAALLCGPGYTSSVMVAETYSFPLILLWPVSTVIFPRPYIPVCSVWSLLSIFCRPLGSTCRSAEPKVIFLIHTAFWDLLTTFLKVG